ncbi:phytoene desaturase family protein [Pseudonocardia asaccharolytica]|uniref:Phytoene dehydrogenase n=1 Tax=Pseudonocardia asaccharolytica DSM 44247 = NBRC 16224 TaxID=1123024 RepID=A0A511CXA1_9PSEU|nr:phytoene desaturase family protein [Pseudonocardia asaccharolytica]GEL17185.1 phytoene dehydrogenase [Pseudonocardia asaccharolytica DSM 44247 = NBRC 16224]
MPPRTVPGRTDHVVVVGAGFAGLSAALHLLGAGRRVTVVERAGHPGGRAGQLDLQGPSGTFRVDTGPTVLTMPELLDETLNAVGERLGDRLDLVALEPAYRARFADGSTIDVHTDAAAMEEEVRRTCGPRAAAGYRTLRDWLTRLYHVEIETFIGANFDSPLDLLNRDLVRLVALGGFGRLGAQVARRIPDERLRRVFTFQSLYAGVPPRRALAAYGVIAYMDTVAGVYFPGGGMRAVSHALADAAVHAGAKIYYGRTVTGLERRCGRVTAVRHAGEPGSDTERLPCDAVVLTPDLPVIHRLLGHRPRRPVPPRYSPSAVVLHAGLARTRPELAHHTVCFGAAWDRTFDEIAREGLLMSDPSLLITRPTATDPSLAPDGHDLLYVLAPCPNTDRARLDWPRIGPAYRDELLTVLENRGLPGLRTDIEVSSLVTPADWTAAGMAAGTPFSLAHTFSQTGPFRPRNLLPGLDNAVLAGCGTTPGVGIPPVLISGRLAAQRITAARGPRPGRAHTPQGPGTTNAPAVRAWSPT